MSLSGRLAVRVLNGGGLALLLLFLSQQISLIVGMALLIAGFSLWSHWLVFAALLCLRGSFFLQTIYRQTGKLYH